MTAALLCPGPSIAHVTPHRVKGYDLRVGVNRAAIAFECDVWAALDYPTIRDWKDAILGAPVLLTRRQTYIDVQVGLRLHATLVEDIACPVPLWHLKTATAALGLLKARGVREIDVFGADWTDQPDFDGHLQVGSDRSADRWAQESETWQAMVAWLASHGCAVTRKHGSA